MDSLVELNPSYLAPQCWGVGWDLAFPLIPVGAYPAGNWGQGVQRPPQHGANFNVLYCDEHIGAMRFSLLLNPTNTARNWNNDHERHI
jgi:hypothetical protein